MLSFVEKPTRHLIFTGKGGVGKTSIACATAVALAYSGRRVVLVSTDPATVDVVVFDTAPTGHTLRLLELPAAGRASSKRTPAARRASAP